METVTYDLRGVLPGSSAKVEFLRIEVPKSEPIPLALVWFNTPDNPEERGVRIDLQKQIFLDNFGAVDRESLRNRAREIVDFLFSSQAHERIVAPALVIV